MLSQPKLLLAASLVCLVVALLVPLPFQPSRWIETAQNTAHAPVFAIMAVIGLRALLAYRNQSAARRQDYGWILTATALLGVLSELAQGLTGRLPSLLDVGNDIAGATLGLCLYAQAQRGRTVENKATRRATAAAIGVLVTAILILPAWSLAAYWRRQAQLPLLYRFSTALDMFFVSDPNAEIARVPLSQCVADHVPGRDTGHALLVRLDERLYPGVSLREPFPDWTPWQTLLIELANPGTAALQLELRIHDRQHNLQYRDRFNREFDLPPGARTVLRVPTAEIRRAPRDRAMNLQHVAGMAIFRPELSPPNSFCVVSVRLER